MFRGGEGSSRGEKEGRGGAGSYGRRGERKTGTGGTTETS